MVKGVACDEPINKYHPTRQFSALWSILLSPCSSIWINGPLFYCFGLISQPRPAAAASAHYSSLTGWQAYRRISIIPGVVVMICPKPNRQYIKNKQISSSAVYLQVSVNRIHAETTSQARNLGGVFGLLFVANIKAIPLSPREHIENSRSHASAWFGETFHITNAKKVNRISPVWGKEEKKMHWLPFLYQSIDFKILLLVYKALVLGQNIFLIHCCLIKTPQVVR